jgi:hypothetical protein
VDCRRGLDALATSWIEERDAFLPLASLDIDDRSGR